jgi:hypothetical protein
MSSLVFALPAGAMALSFSLCPMDKVFGRWGALSCVYDCSLQYSGFEGIIEYLSPTPCSRQLTRIRMKGRPRWRERGCVAIKRNEPLGAYTDLI